MKTSRILERIKSVLKRNEERLFPVKNVYELPKVTADYKVAQTSVFLTLSQGKSTRTSDGSSPRLL